MVPDQLEAAACSCGSFVHTWKEEAAREELAPVCHTQVIIIIVLMIIVIIIIKYHEQHNHHRSITMIIVIIILYNRVITACIFVNTLTIY